MINKNRLGVTCFQNKKVIHTLCWVAYTLFFTLDIDFEEDNYGFNWFRTIGYTLAPCLLFYFHGLYVMPQYYNRDNFKRLLFLITFEFVLFFFVAFLQDICFYNFNNDYKFYYTNVYSLVQYNLFDYISFSVYSTIWYLFIHLKEEGLKEQLIQQNHFEFEISFLKTKMNEPLLYDLLKSYHHKSLNLSPEFATSVQALSELINYTISHEHLVPILLEEEIKHINIFIELNQKRFGDKLLINFDSIGETNQFYIPHLLLLTLVENAFKHGNIKKEPLLIKLSIQESKLYFTIKNLKNSFQLERKTKLGLKNMKKRLELLYQDNYLLHVNEDEHYFEINLSIFVNLFPVYNRT